MTQTSDFESKNRKMIRILPGIHFWELKKVQKNQTNFFLKIYKKSKNSKNKKTKKSKRSQKSKNTKIPKIERAKGGPKGLRLEVGARRAPELLVWL